MTALGPRARLLAALALANACGTNAEPHATATAAAPTFESEAAAGRVTVELLGVEGADGNVLIALFRDANGFPEGGARAFDKRVLEAQPGVLRAVFDAVPAGPFAMNAFDCVNLIALSAAQANSDSPRLMAGEMDEASNRGTPCESFAECNELVDDSNIDYDGPGGVVEIGPDGDPARAWFDLFDFNDQGVDVSRVTPMMVPR